MTEHYLSIIELLIKASDIYRDASYQGHDSHWDKTMRGGAGCYECIRARELRAHGDAIMNEVHAKMKANQTKFE